MTQLRERLYLEAGTADGAHHSLTPEGRTIYERLATARRERLVALHADWPPEQRQQLADVLRRLARELVPPP